MWEGTIPFCGLENTANGLISNESEEKMRKLALVTIIRSKTKNSNYTLMSLKQNLCVS